jgi:hypothetical protein
MINFNKLISEFNLYFSMNYVQSRAALFLFFFSLLYFVVIFFNLDTLHSVLDNHWQTADIAALKKDPAKALLHLHSQPPLFNFFYWLFSLMPGEAYDYFVLFNCLCQSIVTLILFEISSRILKTPFRGALLALFYLLSPPVLLYSAYAFYPALTSMGFAILIFGFFLIKEKPKLSGILIAFSICYLYMIRSSFSLPAALILLSIFIYLSRKNLSKLMLISITTISTVVLLSLPLKNYLMYGFFGSSSWTPLNLIMSLGVKTPLGPFPTPEKIRQAYPELECKKSYGLLDTEDKKANGEPNYNSCYYIAYINHVMPSITEAFRLPAYLRNVKGNIGAYFNTPDGYFFLKNREQIELYATAYNLSFITLFFKFHQIRVACILLVLYLAYRVKKDRQLFPSILLTVFSLHFFAHVLTDGGESRRHVFDIEFIFFITFSMFIASFLEKRRRDKIEKI